MHAANPFEFVLAMQIVEFGAADRENEINWPAIGAPVACDVSVAENVGMIGSSDLTTEVGGAAIDVFAAVTVSVPATKFAAGKL